MSKEGWATPQQSKKFHFFREGRSLCGKWLFLGELQEPDPGSGCDKTQDDCTACYNRLYKPKVRRILAKHSVQLPEVFISPGIPAELLGMDPGAKSGDALLAKHGRVGGGQ